MPMQEGILGSPSRLCQWRMKYSLWTVDTPFEWSSHPQSISGEKTAHQFRLQLTSVAYVSYVNVRKTNNCTSVDKNPTSKYLVSTILRWVPMISFMPSTYSPTVPSRGRRQLASCLCDLVGNQVQVAHSLSNQEPLLSWSTNPTWHKPNSAKLMRKETPTSHKLSKIVPLRTVVIHSLILVVVLEFATVTLAKTITRWTS